MIDEADMQIFYLKALVNAYLGSWNSEFPFYMILLSFIKFSTIFLVNASAKSLWYGVQCTEHTT